MIQLIINRSHSKSKPFWQPMTKKNPLNCLQVVAISSSPILNNCSLAACLQYDPQGVWIDCSNIFTVDSFSLVFEEYEARFLCSSVENHLSEWIQLFCTSPRLLMSVGCVRGREAGRMIAAHYFPAYVGLCIPVCGELLFLLKGKHLPSGNRPWPLGAGEQAIMERAHWSSALHPP